MDDMPDQDSAKIQENKVKTFFGLPEQSWVTLMDMLLVEVQPNHALIMEEAFGLRPPVGL